MDRNLFLTYGSDAMPPLAGLTAVYSATRDMAVVFGGFTLAVYTSDVRMLDFVTHQWILVTPATDSRYE